MTTAKMLPWTPKERRVLVEMANAGASNSEIARALGRTKGSVQRTAFNLAKAGEITCYRPRGYRVKPVIDMRPVFYEKRCLKCESLFKSEGAHNRVCMSCKETSAWRSGCSYGFAA